MKRNSNQRLKRCLGVMFLTIISTGTPNSKIFVLKPFTAYKYEIFSEYIKMYF